MFFYLDSSHFPTLASSGSTKAAWSLRLLGTTLLGRGCSERSLYWVCPSPSAPKSQLLCSQASLLQAGFPSTLWSACLRVLEKVIAHPTLISSKKNSGVEFFDRSSIFLFALFCLKEGCEVNLNSQFLNPQVASSCFFSPTGARVWVLFISLRIYRTPSVLIISLG